MIVPDLYILSPLILIMIYSSLDILQENQRIYLFIYFSKMSFFATNAKTYDTPSILRTIKGFLDMKNGEDPEEPCDFYRDSQTSSSSSSFSSPSLTSAKLQDSLHAQYRIIEALGHRFLSRFHLADAEKWYRSFSFSFCRIIFWKG